MARQRPQQKGKRRQHQKQLPGAQSGGRAQIKPGGVALVAQRKAHLVKTMGGKPAKRQHNTLAVVAQRLATNTLQRNRLAIDLYGQQLVIGDNPQLQRRTVAGVKLQAYPVAADDILLQRQSCKISGTVLLL